MFLLCAKHAAYWPEKLVDHKAHFFLKIGIDCKFALISGNPKGRLGFFFPCIILQSMCSVDIF